MVEFLIDNVYMYVHTYIIMNWINFNLKICDHTLRRPKNNKMCEDNFIRLWHKKCTDHPQRSVHCL